MCGRLTRQGGRPWGHWDGAVTSLPLSLKLRSRKFLVVLDSKTMRRWGTSSPLCLYVVRGCESSGMSHVPSSWGLCHLPGGISTSSSLSLGQAPSVPTTEHHLTINQWIPSVTAERNLVFCFSTKNSAKALPMSKGPRRGCLS